MKEYLTVLFVFVTLSFCGYMAWIGKFKEYTLAVLIVCIGVSAVFFYNIDQIQKLVFKTKDIELSTELRSIRNDIYAKVEDVKEMGGEIGRIAAFAAVHAGRFVGDDHVDQLVAKRDTIVSMMEKFGADHKDIDGVTSEINRWIEFDLKHELRSALEPIIQDSKKTMAYIENYEVGKTDKEIIASLPNLSADLTPITRSIERLNTFLKEKVLPRKPEVHSSK